MEASAITVGAGTPALVRAVRAAIMGKATDRLFEVAVALSWALVGLSWMPDVWNTAEHSPVGHAVGSWSTVWSVFYVIGALGVLVGVAPARVNLRVAGLVLLGTGMVMEGIAAALFAMSPRVLVFFVYAAVCGLRAFVLVWGYRRTTAA